MAIPASQLPVKRAPLEGPKTPDEDLARGLGVSLEAVALTRACEVFDLHIDTFIPPRLAGYDPLKRHGLGLTRGRFFGHLDVPRMIDGGLTSAMWSVTTNPFRSAASRWRVFLHNIERLQRLVERSAGAMRIARDHAELKAVRESGAHACVPAIQGGNALEAAPEGALSIPDGMITRVTLVHLTNSCFGVTSSPLAATRRGQGLTAAGRELVEQCDAARIFVDLAHINRRGFWDAVEQHDASLPLICTHTGVDGVKPHWRNLDDDQLRAIADSGGTIGVIFHTKFLQRSGGPRDAGMIVEHIAHIVDVVGEDHASIGSDYDGAITPPPGCREGFGWHLVVQQMLDRGWSSDRIAKILGGNALRVLETLRPGRPHAA